MAVEQIVIDKQLGFNTDFGGDEWILVSSLFERPAALETILKASRGKEKDLRFVTPKQLRSFLRRNDLYGRHSVLIFASAADLAESCVVYHAKLPLQPKISPSVFCNDDTAGLLIEAGVILKPETE